MNWNSRVVAPKYVDPWGRVFSKSEQEFINIVTHTITTEILEYGKIPSIIKCKLIIEKAILDNMFIVNMVYNWSRKLHVSIDHETNTLNANIAELLEDE